MKLRRLPALSLFTEPFDTHWWIRELCAEIQCRMDDVFVTDDPLPRGTFSTYFRVIARRDYGGNAQLANLYYLHELRHMRGFLRRKPITDWLEWQRSMGQSELDASVTSECVAHFLIPEARAAFEGQEIWVDRFLNDQRFCWFRENAEEHETDLEQVGVLHGLLTAERLRALATPKHNDFLEWQIQNYGQQNMRWYVIWAKPVGHGPHASIAAWRAVEEQFARPDWVARHPDWLTSVSGPFSDPSTCPFPVQAGLFEHVFLESQERYGNWPLKT